MNKRVLHEFTYTTKRVRRCDEQYWPSFYPDFMYYAAPPNSPDFMYYAAPLNSPVFTHYMAPPPPRPSPPDYFGLYLLSTVAAASKPLPLT